MLVDSAYLPCYQQQSRQPSVEVEDFEGYFVGTQLQGYLWHCQTKTDDWILYMYRVGQKNWTIFES